MVLRRAAALYPQSKLQEQRATEPLLFRSRTQPSFRRNRVATSLWAGLRRSSPQRNGEEDHSPGRGRRTVSWRLLAQATERHAVLRPDEAQLRHVILAALRDTEFELLRPHLSHPALVSGQALHDPNGPIADVFL
jgi:hypothetical protein